MSRWVSTASRLLAFAMAATALVVAGVAVDPAAPVARAETTIGPLHTTGTDGIIYDSANQPVRLVGFNWNGTEDGGRSDYQKIADVCGVRWRTPTDGLGNFPFNFDNMYQVIKDWGYNVIRLPISWHNLEPVAPVWNAASSSYTHTWNQTYLNDLKSIVTNARAAGIMVIVDMHQDYWSPALHDITNWNGTQGYCEGVGMPRWMYPTADAKASTDQNVDFYNGMNWFFRNLHDPLATVTHATPWQLLSAAWDQIAFQFSPASGFADYQAVVGADLFNEPYISYVGGSPPAGQTVLQAAGARLQTFYNAIAPSVTARNPSWLLFFQDSTGGHNAANPAARETPTMTAKPTAPGNWVYSFHNYNFSYGTFSDGVTRHDDFGITVVNALLANARAWNVPLYIGEFTNFNLGVDARQLTDAQMAQTKAFLSWAKLNRVNWTFWAYVNAYRPMTVVDYTTNQPIPVVKNALATGLDEPGPPANQPPVASFTSPCTQLACSFDGSASSDPDGTVTTWAWNFGDGQTGTGTTASHAYGAPGTYTITLTVTDNAGRTGSSARPLTVTGPPGSNFVSDTFTRTVSSGLGTAELGGAWTVGGGATNFSVANGVGRMSATAGGSRTASLDSVQQSSVDMTTSLSYDKTQTGGGTYVGVIGRRINATNDYRLKLRVVASGAVTAQLVRVVGGAETVIQNVAAVPGVTWDRGETLRTRLQVTGVGTTTLAAKVWENGTAEPATWHLQATDATAALQGNGAVGLWQYLSGTSTQTPMILSVDDFIAGPVGGAPPPNQPPVASFDDSCTFLVCSFDGSGSGDPDGTVASYAWNFGDGGSGTGANPSHTYAAAGTYTVTLTVTDNRGATSNSAAPVTVTAPPPNQPPVASFDESCTFLVCSFDGSLSSDPDGTVASYAWDFGDGGSGTGASLSHTYAAAGTYTVTLTVTDNRGATDDGAASVTVTAPPPNQPPVASFGKSCTFLVCSFDGSGSSDPDGTVASYAWDFGDGGSGTGANPSHTYAAAGTYTVTLTVTDNRGATDDSAASVTVTAPPITLYASDAFPRTTSNGWGTADTGGPWTTGSGSLVTVGGGTGNMSMATAGTGPSAFLNAVSSADTDVQVTATTDKAPTGGGIYLSVIGRRVVGAGDYRAKVRLLATGQVSLALVRTSGTGAETVIRADTIVPGLTYSAGTRLRIRTQVTGANPATVRAKVWLAAGSEPAAWTATTTDASPTLQAAGGVGLMTYLSGSSNNAPNVTRFDDFQAGPTG